MTATDIALPFNYEPRFYQKPFWSHMLAGEPGRNKRAVLVHHRRAGKDKTGWNWMLFAAHALRCGTYYYFFPTYAQGKKVVWDGNKDGFRMLDHLPKELIVGTPNETEMQLKVKFRDTDQYSIVQIVGTDRMDSVVGTNPVGCGFSEYALQNPRAWDLTRPILLENDGWAMFMYTPRGRNHGYTLYEMARKHPATWFAQLLTVDDTHAITPEKLAMEREEGMDEDLFQQEYYCSFSGAVQGSYYSKQLELAHQPGADGESRITDVAWEPQLPVETGWDLGVGDSTAIWFVQQGPTQLRVIDYLEASGEGLQYYAKELNKRPYVYEAHHMPHDIKVRELGSGISREITARKLGIKPIRVAPKRGVDEGIHAGRQLFPHCWFDKSKCARGLDVLAQYHKEWDEETKVYKNTPEHDWSSHGADAWRTLATSIRLRFGKRVIARKAVSEFDPLTGREPQGDPVTDFDPFTS